MTRKSEKKNNTHAKMLSSAGESFRQFGFNGIGVDGLARGAGVTSGAFYKHFNSKSDAFAEVLDAGLAEVIEGISKFRESSDENWWRTFAEFYLNERGTCALGESCSMQSLSSEAMRSEAKTKAVFAERLSEIVETTGDDFDAAIANLSILVGGVTLARATGDPELAERIAKAIEKKF